MLVQSFTDVYDTAQAEKRRRFAESWHHHLPPGAMEGKTLIRALSLQVRYGKFRNERITGKLSRKLTTFAIEIRSLAVARYQPRTIRNW